MLTVGTPLDGGPFVDGGSRFGEDGAVCRATGLLTVLAVVSLAIGCGDDRAASGTDSDPGTTGQPGATTIPLPPTSGLATSDSGTSGSTGAVDSTASGTDSTGVAPSGAWDVEVFSGAATRVELWIFVGPHDGTPALIVPLDDDGSGNWSTSVPEQDLRDEGVETIYYGFRAWGPNWPYDPSWEPGSSAGFVADVDGEGNRFNPNKLLIDPYARELSHDPQSVEQGGYDVYASGPEHRLLDSAARAPKSIALTDPPPLPAGPERSFADDVVYEVHVRGLTFADAAVDEECRGTYAAAASKAAHLADLGFTAIELLPVHETDNDRNDLAQGGDNYWGYSTINYFAPDRRYACDRSPGGPTREFREMVQAFHAQQIKVFIDVVYNHSVETDTWGSPDTAAIFSMRGLDNANYYETTEDGMGYVNNSGVGPNLNVAREPTQRLILRSLRYAHEVLGVDGFRFDLASVLGNRCATDCFEFSDTGLLHDIAQMARAPQGGAGVDLLAEPWGIGPGTYQLGNFPSGWSEWNGQFRDVIRRDQNRYDAEDVSPGDIVRKLQGSPELFADDGRTPAASVNFLVAHDGFTLYDLYSCDDKVNDQDWPFGPSDGGSDQNYSRDWGDAFARRKVARSGVALLMSAAGVPMLGGGDEFLRSLRCNNNPYNLDSPANWLDWEQRETESDFADFVRSMIAFRGRHPSIARNDDFYVEARWLDDGGAEMDADYRNNASLHFVAMYLPTGAVAGETVEAIYLGYNGWEGAITATLPSPPVGTQWFLAADTNVAQPVAAPRGQSALEDEVLVADRSVVLAVAR